jgi:hypothetical protein
MCAEMVCHVLNFCTVCAGPSCRHSYGHCVPIPKPEDHFTYLFFLCTAVPPLHVCCGLSPVAPTLLATARRIGCCLPAPSTASGAPHAAGRRGGGGGWGWLAVMGGLLGSLSFHYRQTGCGPCSWVCCVPQTSCRVSTCCAWSWLLLFICSKPHDKYLVITSRILSVLFADYAHRRVQPCVAHECATQQGVAHERAVCVWEGA